MAKLKSHVAVSYDALLAIILGVTVKRSVVTPTALCYPQMCLLVHFSKFTGSRWRLYSTLRLKNNDVACSVSAFFVLFLTWHHDMPSPKCSNFHQSFNQSSPMPVTPIKWCQLVTAHAERLSHKTRVLSCDKTRLTELLYFVLSLHANCIGFSVRASGLTLSITPTVLLSMCALKLVFRSRV